MIKLKNKLTGKVLAKKIAALLSAGLLYFSAPTAKAQPEIMPLDEVAAGMRGVAYTVIDDSNEIKEFSVKIIGIVEGGRGGQNMILAEAYGPIVEKAGGVLQGMSGSPVYIDGLLVGAAAATFKEMNSHTFLIRPIEDMLPLWEMPDKKGVFVKRSIDLKEEAKKREERAKKDAEKKKAKETAEDKKGDGDAMRKPNAPKAAEAVQPPTDSGSPYVKVTELEKKEEKSGADAKKNPLDADSGEEQTTLYAAGFDTASFKLLKEKLGKLGYRAALAAIGRFGRSDGDPIVDYEAELKPGSPIGVGIVHGDFSLGAIGTVTATEDEKVLAFGHQFLHKGNPNFFLTNASVVGTVSNLTDGMKIANEGKIIGRINQDRTAGVAGVLGSYPTTVPMRVTVEDKALNRKARYSAITAYDEDFLPVLAAIVPLAALNKTADSSDIDMVDVSFKIRTSLLDGVIERRNLFFVGEAKSAIEAFGELNNAVKIITSNSREESDVFGIDVKITSDSERRTARLISAVPDRREAAPGDTVIFKTTYQPYRGEKKTIDVPFKVPLSRPDGMFVLDLHGGGLVQVSKVMAEAMASAADMEKKETVEDALQKFLSRHANDEIIVEPTATPPVLSEKEQRRLIRQAAARAEELAAAAGDSKFAPKEEIAEPVATGYIIENVIQASIKVNKKAKAPAKAVEQSTGKAATSAKAAEKGISKATPPATVEKSSNNPNVLKLGESKVAAEKQTPKATAPRKAEQPIAKPRTAVPQKAAPPMAKFNYLP